MQPQCQQVMSPIAGTHCASPQQSGMANHPAGQEGRQLTVSPQGRSFSRTSGRSPGQSCSRVNAPPTQLIGDIPSMGVNNPCAFRHEGRDTVSRGLMNRSGTPGMGVPLAEGTRTVPVGYVLPADCGNTGVARSVEGDAQIRQGCTGNVSLPPSVGGIPVGGNTHCQVLATGNVAQFSGRDASGSGALGELEALLNQLQYVSNGPGPPLLEILAGSNFEDDGWISMLRHLASPIGNEAYGQASAPCVVGAHVQSDGNTGQLVKGLSGMCTPHPGACQCGVGNPLGSRCSAGNVGPSCPGNPGTVDGHCADSGGVLPESIRVSGSNMPHPMGSARAGDSLGDRGFEVTASIQSGTPIHALRPSTVGGLASFGGALHRSPSGPCANWPRATQPEIIGSSNPEGAGMFFYWSGSRGCKSKR